MSRFIDGSKDPELTAVFDSNMMKGTKINDAAHLWGPKGGTPAWNDPGQFSGVNSENGLTNRAPPITGPGATDASLFNATTPAIKRQSGVNYQPSNNAGHSVKDDPFAGDADGMPGDNRQLWRK